MTPELEAFGLSAACGAGMLLLWDIIHGLRRVFFKGVISNILLDMLWWFISVSVFLWCIWETVALRLRFFEMFAMVCSALLYHFTVSGLMRKLFCALFGYILKIIQFIFKILLTPARFLDKILKRLFIKRKRGRIV